MKMPRNLATAALSAFGLSVMAATAAHAQSFYPSAVLADKPQAYFRLGSVTEKSQVNGYTTAFGGDATVTEAGGGAPLTGDPHNVGVALDGISGTSVFTSLSSSDASDPSATYAGTITAWIDLSLLPSDAGRTYYIAGRSAYGNDFDLQIQPDNILYFYTDSGSAISYALPTTGASSVLNKYVFIAATVDPTGQMRSLYLNGVQVATQSSYTGDNSYKTSQFTIGESSLFGGRAFEGSIDEVALFNKSLTASQISSLYTASFTPVAKTLSLSPTSVVGGNATSTGTFTLTGPAPSSGLTVKLTSSDTSAATVAPTLTVPAGATSAKFKITTYVVSADKSVTITSSLNGTSKKATLTVTPVTVASLSVSPTSVQGGSATSTGTITLTDPAPSSGLAVSLKSSDTSAATLAGTLNISAGATSAKFKITTYAVTSIKTVTITSSVNGSSKTAMLTVTPAPVIIMSLTLSPTSVKGGSATSTGTITLSGPAPTGGLAVTQTSSDTSAATLAPTLNIPAGATSAKFKITTYAVSSTKTVTITSAVNGTSKTATLTVTH